MPAPSPHTRSTPASFARIEEDLQTALAILTDPVAPARGALPHLEAVRAGLLHLAPEQPLDTIDAETLGDEDIYELAVHLGDHLRTSKARLLPEVAARARLYRRVRLGLIGAGVLVIALILGVIWTREVTQGPWHGKYYQNMHFKGPVRARRDKDVNFHWGVGIPMRALPTNHFSIRWDTCIEVSREITPMFQLTADDGARLFVNGEQIIDVWNAPRGDTQSGRVTLAPGSHHLRVDYYEDSRSARVGLMISIDGEKPRRIPRSMLRYPGNRFGRGNPCRPAAADDTAEQEPVEEERQPPSPDEAADPTSDDSLAPPLEDN